jgi:hypothetical protein
MIGYLGVNAFVILIASVRQEKFDFAAGAALIAALLSYMFARLWVTASERAKRDRGS